MRKIDYANTFSGKIEFIKELEKKGKYSLWECFCHKCNKTFISTAHRIINYHSRLPKGSDKSLKQCPDCQACDRALKADTIPDTLVQAKASSSSAFYLASRFVVCEGCKMKFDISIFSSRDYFYKYKGKVFCSYSCYNNYIKTIDSSIRKKWKE